MFNYYSSKENRIMTTMWGGAKSLTKNYSLLYFHIFRYSIMGFFSKVNKSSIVFCIVQGSPRNLYNYSIVQSFNPQWIKFSDFYSLLVWLSSTYRLVRIFFDGQRIKSTFVNSTDK